MKLLNIALLSTLLLTVSTSQAKPNYDYIDGDYIYASDVVNQKPVPPLPKKVMINNKTPWEGNLAIKGDISYKLVKEDTTVLMGSIKQARYFTKKNTDQFNRPHIVFCALIDNYVSSVEKCIDVNSMDPEVYNPKTMVPIPSVIISNNASELVRKIMLQRVFTFGESLEHYYAFIRMCLNLTPWISQQAHHDMMVCVSPLMRVTTKTYNFSNERSHAVE